MADRCVCDCDSVNIFLTSTSNMTQLATIDQCYQHCVTPLTPLMASGRRYWRFMPLWTMQQFPCLYIIFLCFDA